MKGSNGLSRRTLLGGVMSMAGVGVAAGVTPARGTVVVQNKISQQQAQYQPQPKNNQRCSGCTLFQPPTSCQAVEGQISPDGWCSLFTPKPG